MNAADILTRLADHGIRPLRRPRLQPGAPGEHRAPCPECDRPQREKDDALAVKIDHDHGAIWQCHRCGWKGGIGGDRDFSRRRENPSRDYKSSCRREVLQPGPCKDETLAPWGRDIWNESEIICRGSVAADYLERRGCRIPNPFGDLRWHRALKHRSGHVGPALIGLVTDVITGDPISLHRTWIKPDGSGKANIEKPRLLLTNHRSDGVIRLWPDEEVTLGLVIGEGLETCLAAERAGYAPTWATISAGNLNQFPVLPIDGLTILVDHDRENPKTGKRAGIEAALAVVARYVAAGFDPKRDLRVILPPTEGQDAADLEIGHGDL